jgi:glutaredoxin
MVDKIEVYVKNEEVIVDSAITGRPISDGLTTHYCTVRESLKTEKVMSEGDKVALEVVKKFAVEKGLKVDVYDISTFKGKLQASLKKVRRTPTIIIGKSRIESEDDLKQLESKLATAMIG